MTLNAKWFVRVKFVIEDMWIGMYWKKQPTRDEGFNHVTVYICIIPCLPIVIGRHWYWESAI